MQRERVCKTLALVMLLLSLATGLCAAKSDNLTLMWEEAIPNSNVYGEKYKYYIDESKTKIMDYNGRKYLQVYWQRNKLFMEQVWFVLTWREAEKAHYTEIFDVGKRKAFILEYLNKDYNPKKGNYDISTIKQNSFDYGDSEQKVMQWISQNRPSLLEEINKANGDTVSVGTQTVTANGDYGFVQTLGNGPVQFVPRMVHKPPTQPAVGDGITRSYVGGVPAVGIRCEHGEFVPQTAPDSGKPLYIIYRASDSTWVHQKNVVEHWIIGIFSYDDETDTFTLYEPVNCTPYKTMHIIDKNQIEIERWSSATGVSQDNPEHFIAKYEKAVISPDWDGAPNRPCDTDGYGWMLTFEDEPEEYQTEVGGWDWLIASTKAYNGGISYDNEVGVDGLFAFLARKGNVGYAPSASNNVEYINKAGADFGASTGHLKYN